MDTFLARIHHKDSVILTKTYGKGGPEYDKLIFLKMDSEQEANQYAETYNNYPPLTRQAVFDTCNLILSKMPVHW